MRATKLGDQVHQEIQRRRESLLSNPSLSTSGESAPLVDDSHITNDQYQVFAGSVAEGLGNDNINVGSSFETLYVSKLQQLLTKNG